VSKTLYMFAKLEAKPELKSQLHERLLEMVELTNQEKGCIFYNLNVDRQNDNVYYFLEAWQDEAALALHMETPYVKAIIADAPTFTLSGIESCTMHQIAPNK
jgi:quinol monooxygenase YgiN